MLAIVVQKLVEQGAWIGVVIAAFMAMCVLVVYGTRRSVPMKYLLPGVVLLVPKFLIVTYLGIFDTYTAMILPLMVDAAGIFIMKQFFDSVSVSIEEAARMDVASVFRTFWSVVLPMARPSLITLTILSFHGSWNEFSHFLVVTQRPELKTMVTGLASLTSGELGSGTQFPLKMGAALLTTIPVAVLFFAFQRHFVRGANDGAEKG